MDIDYVGAIRQVGSRLIELGERDPNRPIPTCPGWVVHDVCEHIDMTCRAAIRRRGGQEPAPGLATALSTLFALREELERTPPRGLAGECAIHGWDVENAFGEAQPVPAELACDLVDEFFDSAAPNALRARRVRAGDGQTIHLHRTDGDGEWLVIFDELFVTTHEHAAADATINGTVSDLVLCLWGRIEPPDLIGDLGVFDHLRKVGGH